MWNSNKKVCKVKNSCMGCLKIFWVKGKKQEREGRTAPPPPWLKGLRQYIFKFESWTRIFAYNKFPLLYNLVLYGTIQHITVTFLYAIKYNWNDFCDGSFFVHCLTNYNIYTFDGSWIVNNYKCFLLIDVTKSVRLAILIDTSSNSVIMEHSFFKPLKPWGGGLLASLPPLWFFALW